MVQTLWNGFIILINFIQDHYRKLGNHLLCRFFELFFNTAVLEDWNLKCDPINFELIWNSFQQYEDEFSQSLTEFILNYYTIDGKIDFVKVSDSWLSNFACKKRFGIKKISWRFGRNL